MKFFKFFVKKYIWASNAKEAIRKDKTASPDDVWIDDDWKKANTGDSKEAVGFYTNKNGN